MERQAQLPPSPSFTPDIGQLQDVRLQLLQVRQSGGEQRHRVLGPRHVGPSARVGRVGEAGVGRAVVLQLLGGVVGQISTAGSK